MPTLNLLTSDTTYVSKWEPYTNYCQSNTIRVKHEWSGNSYLGLVKFELPSNIDNLQISRAILYFYLENRYPNRLCGPRQVQLYKNLADFKEDTVNWTNLPPYGACPCGLINMEEQSLFEYIKTDITSIFEEWANRKSPNFGLTLAVTSRDHEGGSVYLDSRRGKYPPFILLEYTPNDGSVEHPNFCNRAYRIYGNQSVVYSTTINTSCAQASAIYFKNEGSTAVNVKLQLSPDGIIFMDNMGELTLTDASLDVLTPAYLAKYMRARVINSDPSAITDVKMWLQSQRL